MLKNNNEKKYAVYDKLLNNSSIHCASLAITKDVIDCGASNIPQFAQPSDELENGTITFVKHKEKVYGITCSHVVNALRKNIASSDDCSSYSMRIMVNGFYVVLDRFFRPNPMLGCDPLDIEIRELNPKLLEKIGKTPIDLDLPQNEPQPITHGYAVGFPTAMKYKKEEQFGYRISLPQIEILAEIDPVYEVNGRFVVRSTLDEAPIQSDYSGMSGGPIFWTTEDTYGILGIIYEGDVKFGTTVCIFGELAKPDVIKGWIDELNTRDSVAK